MKRRYTFITIFVQNQGFSYSVQKIISKEVEMRSDDCFNKSLKQERIEVQLLREKILIAIEMK